MRPVGRVALLGFATLAGFVIGSMAQEMTHETGRCADRSTKCPCEERAMRRQFDADRSGGGA